MNLKTGLRGNNMRTIEYWYGTRNDRVYYTMEVADNATDEEIEAIIWDELYDYIDYGYNEIG